MQHGMSLYSILFNVRPFVRNSFKEDSSDSANTLSDCVDGCLCASEESTATFGAIMINILVLFNRRLNSIISTLKHQPPCPQLYLYSSGDKVIPASVIERYIQEQKASGRTVRAHDFGSSPHVDHYRNFPHIYSAIVNEFLKHCCSTDVSKA